MKTSFASLTCVSLCLSLGGCLTTNTTPELDARFGESFNLMKAQQTMNPDASRNTDAVAGMDGKAAKSAMDQYRKSFGQAKESEGRSPAISVNNGGGNSNE